MARFLKNRKSLVGKSPGTLTFIGKQKMENSRLRLMVFNREMIEEWESDNIDELIQKTDKNQVNWINIDGVHDQELIQKIGTQFDISPLVLEDIVNTDQRPKITYDKQTLSVFLKMLWLQEPGKTVNSEQISIILGSWFVITFQERTGEFFEPIRNRIRQNIGRVRNGDSDYLFYRIFDTIADNYMLCISELGDNIEKHEKKVLTGIDKEIVETIFNYKTEISFIRKSVRPASEISKQLKASDSPLIKKTTRPFIENLDAILTHAQETIELYHSMTADYLNIYNANQSNSANDVMKVLTIFAAIFIPLTFIAGVYGTNFDHIPELHYKYSYFIMLIVMLIVAVIMLFYFRKKKWL